MSHKQHATEVLALLSFPLRDLKNGMGLFCSELIILTLSSYYGQIHSVVDVCDVHHYRYYCDEGPIGAIALSLTAVSLDVVYTQVC